MLQVAPHHSQRLRWLQCHWQRGVFSRVHATWQPSAGLPSEKSDGWYCWQELNGSKTRTYCQRNVCNKSINKLLAHMVYHLTCTALQVRVTSKCRPHA